MERLGLIWRSGLVQCGGGPGVVCISIGHCKMCLGHGTMITEMERVPMPSIGKVAISFYWLVGKSTNDCSLVT